MINMGVFNQRERGRTSLIMGNITPSAWLWACSHWEVVPNTPAGGRADRQTVSQGPNEEGRIKITAISSLGVILENT